MKKCPFCSEMIQDEAIKCRYCGSMLNGQNQPPIAKPDGVCASPAAVAAAPKSGDETPSTAVGAPEKAATPPPETVEPQKNPSSAKKLWGVGIVAAVLAFVGIAIVAAFFFFSGLNLPKYAPEGTNVIVYQNSEKIAKTKVFQAFKKTLAYEKLAKDAEKDGVKIDDILRGETCTFLDLSGKKPLVSGIGRFKDGAAKELFDFIKNEMSGKCGKDNLNADGRISTDRIDGKEAFVFRLGTGSGTAVILLDKKTIQFSSGRVDDLIVTPLKRNSSDLSKAVDTKALVSIAYTYDIPKRVREGMSLQKEKLLMDIAGDLELATLSIHDKNGDIVLKATGEYSSADAAKKACETLLVMRKGLEIVPIKQKEEAEIARIFGTADIERHGKKVTVRVRCSQSELVELIEKWDKREREQEAEKEREERRREEERKRAEERRIAEERRREEERKRAEERRREEQRKRAEERRIAEERRREEERKRAEERRIAEELKRAEDLRRAEELRQQEKEDRRHRDATADLVIRLSADINLPLMKVEAGELKIRGRRIVIRTTKDFYIGQTEVTLAQWKAVMKPEAGKELADPADFKGDERPVALVSAYDAMEFCRKLNESGRAPQGWKFTLPTELQWEYAARGGRNSRWFQYSGSNNLASVAWYGRQEKSGASPVAKKSPNELGLYDMSGNLWEWCSDRRGGSGYVARGGSFFSSSNYCRVSSRSTVAPSKKFTGIGFRVVLVQDK